VLRLGVRVTARFRVYLLRLVHFYQAYYTLVVRYSTVTSQVAYELSFQISRSTGVSVATALFKTIFAQLNKD